MWRWLGCALVTVISLNGCISPRARMATHEVQLKEQRYRVWSSNSDTNFAKVAAFYRSAELCLKKGFRFFRIRDEGAITSNMPLHIPDQDREGERGRGVDVGSTQPGTIKGPPSGYSYLVDFYASDPGTGDADDAQRVLSQFYFPGTNEIQKPSGAI